MTNIRKFKHGHKTDLSDRALEVIFMVFLICTGAYGILIARLNRESYITAVSPPLVEPSKTNRNKNEI